VDETFEEDTRKIIKKGMAIDMVKSLKENDEKYRVKITMGENGKRKSHILKLNEKVLSHMTIDYSHIARHEI